MKKNKKSKYQSSFIKLLDTVFVVNGEMIQDNGEDSYICSVNEEYGLIATFDGCGGIGSRKYEEYDNKTGAYIASHASGEVLLNWFNDFSKSDKGLSSNTISSVCSDIQNNISHTLKNFESNSQSSIIKGSMTKSFPTTGSIILFTSKNSKLYSAYIWAGDSRGFILTSSGLSQITRDDIEDNEDALSNLSNDSRLTNVISADGDYNLNSKIISCDSAAVLVTATDGCFGYFHTPMEFEYMLLDTLLVSENLEEWEQNIDSYIRQYTADDYTLGLAIYGFGSMRRLKNSMMPRHEELYHKYVSKLADADEQEKVKLWNEYKINFYREV